MYGKSLQAVAKEKDFEVTLSNDLKHAYTRANTMFGFIARNLESKTPDMMVSMYNSMLRSYRGYGMQSWSPNLQKGH